MVINLAKKFIRLFCLAFTMITIIFGYLLGWDDSGNVIENIIKSAKITLVVMIVDLLLVDPILKRFGM